MFIGTRLGNATRRYFCPTQGIAKFIISNYGAVINDVLIALIALVNPSFLGRLNTSWHIIARIHFQKCGRLSVAQNAGNPCGPPEFLLLWCKGRSSAVDLVKSAQSAASCLNETAVLDRDVAPVPIPTQQNDL